MANTDFEGGDNDNGYGDYIFLVKHGQPSHSRRAKRGNHLVIIINCTQCVVNFDIYGIYALKGGAAPAGRKCVEFFSARYFI